MVRRIAARGRALERWRVEHRVLFVLVAAPCLFVVYALIPLALANRLDPITAAVTAVLQASLFSISDKLRPAGDAASSPGRRFISTVLLMVAGLILLFSVGGVAISVIPGTAHAAQVATGSGLGIICALTLIWAGRALRRVDTS